MQVRLILTIWLLMTALAGAQTHIRFDAAAFNANPATNRVVEFTPRQPFLGNPIQKTTDSSGVCYLSNALPVDYSFTIRQKGSAGAINGQLTVTATNLGVVDADEITSVAGAQTYPSTGKSAWSIQASDGRYLKLADTNSIIGGSGVNVTGSQLAATTTNAGVVTVTVPTNSVVSVIQQQLSAGSNTFTGTATLSGFTASGNLNMNINGGTVTAGANTMSPSGFSTPGGILNPTGFAGNAYGLTNLPSAEVLGILETNSTVVFNVEKYGARSGTDSTVAISNAIVAATLVGGKVYFPNRNYQISAPLYLRGQVTLYSDADVESAQAAIGTITNTGTFDSIIITNYPLMPNGIKIIGVNLTANSRGSGSVAIRVQGDGTAADQLSFRDFEINGFGTAVLLSNVANSVFQKVSVAYCDVGWRSDGPVNHSLTWITCPAGEVGIGYLLKSGWAHIMGCDIVYRTNAISASGTRILLENINMEVSPVAVNSARPIAIHAVSQSTSGYPTLDMRDVRVSSWSGEALTNSFSVLASNYVVRLGTGNLLLLNGYGSQIAEYNTIPSLVTESSGTRTTYIVTNITAGFAYRARPIATDLQASGVSASSSTWGDQYLNIRNSGANDQWIYNGKFVDGTYRQVNLLDFFTEKTIYNRMLLGTNAGAGFSGAGFTDGIGGLDVGATRIVLGAENNSTARGNNVAKIGHISMMPYSTANPVFTLIHGYSPSGINQLTIGGGNSGAQSATEIIFRPAATVATGAGTIVGRINTSLMEVGVPLVVTNGAITGNGLNVTNLQATNIVGLANPFYFEGHFNNASPGGATLAFNGSGNYNATLNYVLTPINRVVTITNIAVSLHTFTGVTATSGSAIGVFLYTNGVADWSTYTAIPTGVQSWFTNSTINTVLSGTNKIAFGVTNSSSAITLNCSVQGK